MAEATKQADAVTRLAYKLDVMKEGFQSLGLTAAEWRTLRRGKQEQQPFEVGDNIFITIGTTPYMFVGTRMMELEEPEPFEVILQLEPVRRPVPADDEE